MTENDVYEALELIAAREPVPLSLLGRRGLALPGLACRERGWVQQPDRDGPLFTTQEGRKALAAFDACRAHAKRIEEGLCPIGEISAPQSVRDDLRKRVLAPGETYNEEAPTSNLVSEVRARLDDAVNAAVSMIQGYTETTQEFAKLREGLEVQAVNESTDEGRDVKQVQTERVAELEDTSAFEKHLDELRARLDNHGHVNSKGLRRLNQLGLASRHGHKDRPNESLPTNQRSPFPTPDSAEREVTRNYAKFLVPAHESAGLIVNYVVRGDDQTPQLNDVQLSQLAADCAAAVVVPPEETKP